VGEESKKSNETKEKTVLNRCKKESKEKRKG
jgi:hypothetical protein